jgi:OOP family OmpA-OmpF porin
MCPAKCRAMCRAAPVLTAAAIAGGALTGALSATGAAAQVDPGAPAGAVQTAHAVRDFDSYDLPVGPFGPGEQPVRTVEGGVAWSAWRLDDAQASVAGVLQGYRERLAALGFEPVFACAGEACGGFDFRFGAEILPPPGMLVDVRDFAQLTAAREDPAGFVSVLASRVLDAADAGAPVRAAVEITEVPSVETAPQTVILPQDERALLAQLTGEGRVPVQGLAFAVGGAALSQDSAEALDMLARMLRRNDDLAVAIVGHSDNQGGLALNLDLSQRRAEAVMRALVDRGVPPARVEARGIGYLAPRASNATPEGRALNRRVELVLR